MKKILFAGGGTLGHILPNITLAKNLEKHGYQAYYIGNPDSFEEETAKKNNIEFFKINAVKLDRLSPLKNLKIPYMLPKSIKQTLKILDKIKPNIIFCKGGYVSLPVILAGKIRKIPIICHESDSSFGIVNKIALTLNILTLVNTKKLENNKTIYVGIPLKNELFEGNSSIAQKEINYQSNGKKNILVFGGSLGAKSLNEKIISMKNLRRKYNIILIGGKTLPKNLNYKNLYTLEFTDHIENYYALSDIIICRSGATTIAEIKALNKKAILVPLPTNVSRGDQLENAKNVECDQIKIIQQENLDEKTLLDLLKALEKEPIITQKFKNPTNKIIKIIQEQTN